MIDEGQHRIESLSADQVTFEQRQLIEEWQADRGQQHPPGALWWLLLRSPAGMRAVGKLGAFARTGTQLPDAVRVAAVLSVVSQRGYTFEIDIQRANMARVGIAKEHTAAIEARDFSALPTPLAAVSRLAYAIADSGVPAPELVQAVRAELDEQQVVEVALVSGYFSMLSDVAATFGY